MTKMNRPSDRQLGIFCTLPWDFSVLGEFFSPSGCVYTSAFVWSNRAVWKRILW